MKSRPASLIALGLALGLGARPDAAAAQAPATPPPGFTAVFNGKNLAGWHGMPHFDPRKLAAMGEDERAKQIAAWTEEAKKHWRVEEVLERAR